MTYLLEKDTPSFFSDECLASFKILKKKLTEAPILLSSDWDLPFELMCDASYFAVGAVLGQRNDKYFRPIHYASKTLSDAQTHYTTTEKRVISRGAYKNSLIYKEKTKNIHDAKIKNQEFHIGDRVLLFNSKLKFFSGKLKSRWSDPFRVAEVFPYGTVVLSQPYGHNFKVNGHRIKHYFGGDIPAMDVPDLHLSPKDN
ncbi:reverse transcriptase domain-containing protein [Tanacetum coccineum]|uniref:Reverse transcriptase domain-containing protein n=1 Tax=Tanacetum coccineum TaxID=301880 RepID=A0ABQ5GIN7_9ASTR